MGTDFEGWLTSTSSFSSPDFPQRAGQDTVGSLQIYPPAWSCGGACGKLAHPLCACQMRNRSGGTSPFWSRLWCWRCPTPQAGHLALLPSFILVIILPSLSTAPCCAEAALSPVSRAHLSKDVCWDMRGIASSCHTPAPYPLSTVIKVLY